MKPRLLLLDRDGTLIYNRHYLADPAGVELLPGVVEGLRQFRRQGWRLALVSNQSGVGRGYFDETAVEAVNARLQELLEAHECGLDLLLYCPHAPEAGCGCRKPNPDLALRASRELGVPLERAIVIGDSECDLELARRLGVPGHKVDETVTLEVLAGELAN